MSKITHAFRPTTKIDACCDTTSVRYALGNVEIIPDGDKSVFATATDGKILSVARCGGRADRPALLPARLAKPDKDIHLNSRWECDGKVAEEGEGRMPRFSDCLPEIDPERCTVLRIDAKRLKQIADAVNSQDDCVTLIILPNEPIMAGGSIERTVAVRGDFTGIGAIIPIRCNAREEVEQYNAAREDYAQAWRTAHLTPKESKPAA